MTRLPSFSIGVPKARSTDRFLPTLSNSCVTSIVNSSHVRRRRARGDVG